MRTRVIDAKYIFISYLIIIFFVFWIHIDSLDKPNMNYIYKYIGTINILYYLKIM